MSAIGIDLKSGALGIPDNIKRVGWWRDGATPGDEAGTVLLAGHVDSAKAGAGAFYALKSARRGDIVTRHAGAKTLRYRVTTMQRMRKAALPTSIYTRTGSPKLVLVTCGGPFDAKSGHYRDNIVVTAVPACMLLEHRGKSPQVDPSAYVAPNAILCGDVRIGPDARVLFGAVLTAEDGASRSARAA